MANRVTLGKKLPSPVRGGRRTFGTTRQVGIQIEYPFRRLLPLDEKSSKDLHRFVSEVVKANRYRYKWFFVSLLVSVKGGLYRVSIVDDPEAEERWETQWVSTPVTNHTAKLHASLDRLLDELIPAHTRGRFAKLLRFRGVFLKNVRREPK